MGNSSLFLRSLTTSAFHKPASFTAFALLHFLSNAMFSTSLFAMALFGSVFAVPFKLDAQSTQVSIKSKCNIAKERIAKFIPTGQTNLTGFEGAPAWISA
jgi:hypothetical protein